ncbi:MULTISPECIES: hypothetical protein [Bifidobacterium]|uniref:hypothetical protein n=1 Tax=Bifidobacterium TaxID=1678 RepID=UPI001BDBED7D|nr:MULTISPECIES: hypothetical protein [Bifidobacterium]MBT1160577.1 hypothetical protein [Bifidobacterium sp. SO1]MBW3078541.1 hypothetical protein [Bifidobacterium simiiventris]
METQTHADEHHNGVRFDRSYYERLGERISTDMETTEYPEPADISDDPNPGARLKRLVYQKKVFEQENRRQTRIIVDELRRRGASWNVIGKLMNISGEAVRKQYSR